MKFILTPLACIVFAPAGLLWLAAEILYVVVFFFKLSSSIFASLAAVASVKIDCGAYKDLYNGDTIGTAKQLIRTEIAEQMEALHLSSVFFERKR